MVAYPEPASTIKGRATAGTTATPTPPYTIDCREETPALGAAHSA
ncbi:hypothetical protein ACFYNL_08670 [Streptomyces sp. NPDC007808]